MFNAASVLVCVYVEAPLPTDTETLVAFAYTSVVPILNPAAETAAPPLLLIVAETVNEDAELDVATVEVKDKSENKGTDELKLVSSGCVAVVLIIIF